MSQSDSRDWRQLDHGTTIPIASEVFPRNNQELRSRLRFHCILSSGRNFAKKRGERECPS